MVEGTPGRRTPGRRARVWPDPDLRDEPWGDGGDGGAGDAGAAPGPAPGPTPEWLRPERDRPPPGGLLPSVADLVRIGTDHAPSLVAEGPDRVLGPWAIDAPREVLLVATALAAFLVPEDDDTTPVDRVLRELSGPAAAGLRAARWAPLAPWAVEPCGDGRVLVTPLLPMGSGAPAGPVAWGPVPAVAGGGDLVFARIAPALEGWALVAGLALPAPPAGTLSSAARRLTAGRPPTTEGTLRARGHALLRGLLEREWATTRTIRTPTP